MVKFKNLLLSGLFLFPFLAMAEQDSTVLKLTPQYIVDQAVLKGLEAKDIRLTQDLNQSPLAEALAPLDWQWTSSLNYELSEAEQLGSFENERDITLGASLGLSKKILTGTQFSLNYDRTSRDSILSPIANQAGSPNDETLDIMTLKFTQDLLKNAFGTAERARLKAARLTLKNASYNEQEALESLVVASLEQFWQTYVAKEQLRQNIEARNRYEELVKSVEKKSQLGYTQPGELAQVKAELEEKEQRIKNASASYLNALDELSRRIQVEFRDSEEIQFEIENLIPNLPTMKPVQVEKLRPWKMQSVQLSIQKENLKAVQSRQKPSLQLTGQVQFTGAEEEPSEALNELSSGNHPLYSVGLQLSHPLGSKAFERELQQSKSQVYQKEILLKKKKQQLENQYQAAERNVRAHFFTAQSALKAADYREEAVKEFEKAYQQGRTDINDVIQVYNSYLNTQTKRVQAIGDYHMALDRFAEVRDELIFPEKDKEVQ